MTKTHINFFIIHYMVNTTLVKHCTCYTSTACATYGMNLARAHSLFWFLQNFFYTALVLFTNTRS